MTSQLAVLKPSSLTDWLLEHGRHFVTTPEIAELLGVSATSVPVTLHRARTANKIVSVTKGAWVPVPPAHRSAGAPPPVQFIDELMNHLGHPYYIGFLSAARIHGASHQVPMSLPLVVLEPLRVGYRWASNGAPPDRDRVAQRLYAGNHRLRPGRRTRTGRWSGERGECDGRAGARRPP